MRASITMLAALAMIGIAGAQIPPGGSAAGSGIFADAEKTFPQIAEGAWSGKRLRDGQPDVEGHWANTVANHNNWTDPQGGAPGEGRPVTGPRSGRAPSRVSDPADGQMPYQPWARAKQQEFAANFANPTKPEYIEPLARCAPAGVPKSFTWHGFEIRQYPGSVLFLFNSGYRLIHIDDRPHLPGHVKLWNGDSRGRWEGNTLVVQVRNLNGKALLGRTGDFIGPNAEIEERYTFSADGKRFNYVAHVNDPETFTRPWTATIPMKRWTENDTPNGWHYEASPANAPGQPRFHERMERVCVENNGPFGGGAIGVPLTTPIIRR